MMSTQTSFFYDDFKGTEVALVVGQKSLPIIYACELRKRGGLSGMEIVCHMQG